MPSPLTAAQATIASSMVMPATKRLASLRPSAECSANERIALFRESAIKIDRSKATSWDTARMLKMRMDRERAREF